MPRDIAHHLATAGRMTDMHRALGTELLDHRGRVIGVVIHVVAVPDLAGAAVATAIMRDNAEALVHEKHHLRVPVVGTERPAVVEMDDLGVARAPVLVEDLDAVFGSDRSHVLVSLGAGT